MKRTATIPEPPYPERQTPDVKLDSIYPSPPERVWQALTDPRRLAQWLLPNDFAPRLGHRFTFREKRRPPIRCEVIALEENRRLAYTWQRGSDEPLSVVTWTLEPVGSSATRVRLTHTGLHACAAGYSHPWLAAPRRLFIALDPVVRIPRPLPGRPEKTLWRNSR